MKLYRFYIRQGPDEWQICAINLGVAVVRWRAHACYHDRTPVEGRPDQGIKWERIK